MTDYISSPSTAHFILTWGAAHPGQNFTGIDRVRFNLTFGKVISRAGYVEKIDTTSYSLTMQDLSFLHTYAVGPLLPASFTLLTSRTNPDEPQPVSAQ